MVAMARAPYRARVTVSRAVLELKWVLHRTLFSLTGGRVGAAPPRGGVGTLFLLSTGRKSGKVRRNGIYYVEDGPRLAVVASNAGENVDPQWWKNLEATPEAEVELGTHRQPIRARRATPEETERLWPRFDAGHPEFAEYRARAYRRTIPIVIFEPREAAAADTGAAESPSAEVESG
jgi:deazaflavin-dependent oxidoreductase (nitroreductase family)